jgi:hypothetical protein
MACGDAAVVVPLAWLSGMGCGACGRVQRREPTGTSVGRWKAQQQSVSSPTVIESPRQACPRSGAPTSKVPHRRRHPAKQDTVRWHTGPHKHHGVMWRVCHRQLLSRPLQQATRRATAPRWPHLHLGQDASATYMRHARTAQTGKMECNCLNERVSTAATRCHDERPRFGIC